MKHRSKFRRYLMSGTLLVLTATLITGCGLTGGGHTFGDLTGETRTLPDGDEVNFDNRHTPILNPGTNQMMSAPSPMGEHSDISYSQVWA